MAKVKPKDDLAQINEDITSVQGNVFDNDKNPDKFYPYPEERVIEGSLSDNGAGTFGTLTLNEDGTYTYTLTEDMNYLGEGVDIIGGDDPSDFFTYEVEYYDQYGNPQTDTKTIWIDIHGVNDQAVIKDVTVSTFEGGDHAGDVNIYNGQFTLEDVDPVTAGVQTDLDDGDTHTFQVDNGTITVTSADLTAEQIAAIKATVDVSLVDPNATDGDANFGKYEITGDFDALSVGDKATVTFEYHVKDTSEAGYEKVSDPKTVTLTVVGQNDTVEIRDDLITTYDELIDGDIYKSILANDGHYDPMGSNNLAKDIDVNDTLTIASTGFHDLQFYQEGGSISVDNAARMLQYTPGSGGAIAKDHFSFYYQATDGQTDPIGSAVAEVAMVNKNGQDIDWYQFGGNGDDTLNGIKGATNVLSGMGGNDYIEGKEKGDILYGGAGDDIMQGGWGNDIYKGGTGNDGIVDTRGNDLYVFSKGDGRDTIDDMCLEIYTDAMNHEAINLNYFDQTRGWWSFKNEAVSDVVRFDESVDIGDIALFQEDGQFGSLLIKYSDNANDKVSVGWQEEAHYGIEMIEAYNERGDLVSIDTRSDYEENGQLIQMRDQFDSDGDGRADLTYSELIQYIATYDLDGDATNGVQAAQSVQDVQGNEHLMNVIATGWA